MSDVAELPFCYILDEYIIQSIISTCTKDLGKLHLDDFVSNVVSLSLPQLGHSNISLTSSLPFSSSSTCSASASSSSA